MLPRLCAPYRHYLNVYSFYLLCVNTVRWLLALRNVCIILLFWQTSIQYFMGHALTQYIFNHEAKTEEPTWGFVCFDFIQHSINFPIQYDTLLINIMVIIIIKDLVQRLASGGGNSNSSGRAQTTNVPAWWQHKTVVFMFWQYHFGLCTSMKIRFLQFFRCTIFI